MKEKITVYFSESDILPYHPTSLVGEKVVVFAPHPDDETIGCGGAIAAHCKHGDQVKVIILTNGDKADTCNRYNKEEYVEIRKAEAKQAVGILGFNDLEFLGYYDQELNPDKDIAVRLFNLLKIYNPTLIYCPAPTEIHPDHRATSRAVWDSIRNKEFFRPKIVFYEVGIPFRPNTLVDITPYIEIKKKALEAYKSQQTENNYCDKILGLNKYRTYTLSLEVEYAEGFYIVPPEEIKNTPFDLLELRIFQPLAGVELNMAPFEEAIADKDKHIQSLEQAIADKDRHIQSIEQAIANSDRRNQSVEQFMADKNILLNQIQGSFGWQLIDSYHKLVNKYIPQKTMMRKLFDKVITVIKFIKRGDSFPFTKVKTGVMQTSTLPLQEHCPYSLDIGICGEFFSQTWNLNEIQILTATYQRQNADLVLRINENGDNGTVLREIIVKGKDIIDNGYTLFKFRPIKESQGKTYFFELNSSGNPSAAVWYNPGFNHNNLKLNNQKKHILGTISFMTFANTKV